MKTVPPNIRFDTRVFYTQDFDMTASQTLIVIGVTFYLVQYVHVER